MGGLTLPFSGSAVSGDNVFDVECTDGGGAAIAGQSLGTDADGYGGTGVLGAAKSGGTGVSGQAEGTDGFHDTGVGVSGMADGGGIGVYGEASGFDEKDRSPAYGVAGYSPDGGIGVSGAASGNGIGVSGESDGIAINGQSTGVNGIGVVGDAPYVGVSGSSSNANGFGVRGVAQNGGIGVYGESVGGFAMSAVGPTTQDRGSGGWAKALVRVYQPDPNNSVRSIHYCFNSQIAPSTGTVPDCGFQLQRLDIGVYVFDFGFQVNDRFVSVTPETQKSVVMNVNPYADPYFPSSNPLQPNFMIANISFPSANKVMVVTWVPVADLKNNVFQGFIPKDCNFTLLVF